MITIAEFAAKHHAGTEWITWANATGCANMRELWEWRPMSDAHRLWIASRARVLTDRDAILFACWSARQEWHLLTDERSRVAVEVMERFARWEAGPEEREAAHYGAQAAARTVWAIARVICDAWSASFAVYDNAKISCVAISAANKLAGQEAARAAGDAGDAADRVVRLSSRTLYREFTLRGASSKDTRNAQAVQLQTYAVNLETL